MNVAIQKVTATGGRDATVRHIPGDGALSVCMPPNPEAPKGWRWIALTQVAKMESGHTPSREHPEYWGGNIPWIGVKDAGKNHGKTILDTSEHTNALGIQNSSARILPKGTVCLSRGGTVGYVVVLGCPMATSQGFANWICGKDLNPEFLKYLFLSEIAALHRFSMGTTIQTIYYPEIKALHICIPSRAEQDRIVTVLDSAFNEIATARRNIEKNLQTAGVLFESHLQFVFSQHGPGWLKKPLSELCDIKHGFAFKSEFFATKGDYVLLTPGNFYESGGYRARGDKQKYYVGEIPRDYILSKGDLLVAMTEQAAGLLGSPILIPESNKFLHNQRLGLVSKRKDAPWINEFFFYVFNSPAVRKEIHDTATGVKVQHTSPTKIGEVIVSFPTSLSEQAAIVSKLKGLQEQTEHLTNMYVQKLTMLDSLKKSLLHEAFSGKL